MLAACAIVLLALGLSGCASPTPTPAPANNTTSTGITIIDTNGKSVELSGTASRIIVTNSDSAEVLVAIGAQDRIVGVADTVKKNPTIGPLLGNVTSIGSWDSPNMEQIAMLQPDAVIVYASWKPKNADLFATINATILALDCGNMKTIVQDIHAMGTLTGNVNQANDYAGFIQSNLDLVNSRIATVQDRPTVYWEYNKAWSTAGNGSGGDVLITIAGGANIAGNLGNASNPYVTVNSEFVLPKNPQVIIKYTGFSVTGTTLANFTALRNDTMGREGIRGVDATKNGRVYVLSSTIAYGAKGPIGLLYMAKILHPDLFRDVNPAAKLDEYAGRFVPGTNTTIVIFPTPA